MTEPQLFSINIKNEKELEHDAELKRAYERGHTDGFVKSDALLDEIKILRIKLLECQKGREALRKEIGKLYIEKFSSVKNAEVVLESTPIEGNQERWERERGLPQDMTPIPISVVYNLIDRMHLVGDMQVRIGWRKGEEMINTCLIEPWRLEVEMRGYLREHFSTSKKSDAVLDKLMEWICDCDGGDIVFNPKLGLFSSPQPFNTVGLIHKIAELRQQQERE